MRKKRIEYPATPWGTIAWLFQNEFLKLLAVFALASVSTYMFFNFSCDKEGGARIEKTEIKIERKK